MYQSWEGQLGGPGKVVEIDEAFLTTNKYHVGRIQAKQGIMVLGITERDGGPTRVDNVALYNYLLKKEEWRKNQEAARHRGGLRQPHTRRREAERGEEQIANDWVEINEDTTVIVLGDQEDCGEMPEELENDEGLAQPVDSTHTGTRFEFNKDFENEERELFGAKQKTQPHRNLFFVVPDRSAQTMLPIIRKYVARDSIIFTDAWPAYNDLHRDYKHYTVVHKKRFVKYHFVPGPDRVVVKVTTNHIERMWVELRRELRGVEKAVVPERLGEVPYRLMRLSTGNDDANLENALNDIVTFANELRRTRNENMPDGYESSDDEQSNEGQENEP